MNQDLEKVMQDISSSYTAPLNTTQLYDAIQMLWRAINEMGGVSYTERQDAQNVLIQRWKNETLFVGIENLSSAALERIYAHAYEEGHSSGWNDVEAQFDTLLDLIYDVRAM